MQLDCITTIKAYADTGQSYSALLGTTDIWWGSITVYAMGGDVIRLWDLLDPTVCPIASSRAS